MLFVKSNPKKRLFAGAPSNWADVAFHHLRTQGAFLVSAKKQAGVTQFVSVESLIGSPCLIQTDMPNPKILNGKRHVVFSKENVQAEQVIEFSQ